MSSQGVSGTLTKFVAPASHGAKVSGPSDTSAPGNALFSDEDPDLDMIGKGHGSGHEGVDLPTPAAANRSIVLSTAQTLTELSAAQAGADAYAVLALITNSLREQHAGARQIRNQERQSELKSKYAGAEEIRKSIPARMWGGIVAGGMTAIGGAVSFGGAAISATASSQTLKNSLETKPHFDAPGGQPIAPAPTSPMAGKASEQGIELTEVKPMVQPATSDAPALSADTSTLKTKPLDSQTAQADTPAAQEKPLEQRELEAKELDNWHKDLANQLHKDSHSATKGEAASKMLHGAGSATNGFAESFAAEHDAKKADEEATAKAHEMGYQQSNDELNQTQGLLRDLCDKLGAILQSDVEASRSVNRNI
ncbi:type III secretion system translocon subunit SctB [Ottowia sp. VDI28]|uniref:type III secretion system translocon subunit SctB n=1 Tax=Ottowia sp. VDI28 TaxID=3133968 RepID=UPI003C2D9EE4